MAIPYTFTNGTVADADEVNANFVYVTPKIIGAIEQLVSQNTSGTSIYTTIGGSILYLGSGTSKIQDYMEVKSLLFSGDTNPATQHRGRMRISGVGIDMTTAIKDLDLGGGASAGAGLIDHIYTSGAITASGGNVGSQYSITLEERSNATGATTQAHDLVVIGY